MWHGACSKRGAMNRPTLVPTQIPLSARKRSALTSTMSAVLVFGVDASTKSTCDDVARQSGLRALEVRHLRAACTALEGRACVLIIASLELRSWDRTVLEEHARRSKTPIAWVSASGDFDLAERAIRGCAMDRKLRPPPIQFA